MSELRDPPIKLFGADIHLPNVIADSPFSAKVRCQSKGSEIKVLSVAKEDVRHNNLSTRSRGEASKGKCGDDGNLDEDQSVETECGSPEKVLKKPDKLIPCPRCCSLKTKFCYFNNYNVNQPRHFCKNCQRYWTAGGTIRNVPVGAGKRKNKQLPLQYNQVATSSEGAPSAQPDSLDSSDNPAPPNLSISIPSITLDGNDETAAKFCMSPLFESMVPLFSQNESKSVEVGSVTPSKVAEESVAPRELELKDSGIPQFKSPELYYGSTPAPPLPFYTNPQWNIPWVPVAGWNQPGEPISVTTVPLEGPLGLSSPGINFPIVPYWSCIPVFDNRTLAVPLVTCSDPHSLPCATDTPCPSSGSPTLGKHLRETNLAAEDMTEKSLWVPKSKRIDDMDTSAKCPILDSLDVKPGKKLHISRGGVFKAFERKRESFKHSEGETAPVLKANPAALCRSQLFQENT